MARTAPHAALPAAVLLDWQAESDYLFSLVTELYSRKSIQNAKLISNPGCYATSVQALIAPLVPFLDPQAAPTVFGISGYSGAGTKAAPSGASGSGSSGGTVPKITPEELQGGIRPYSLTDHIHEREASRQLQKLFAVPNEDFKVAFIPSVAPWFQGIISTLSAPLAKKMSAKEIRDAFEEFYKDNGGLVQISSKVPEVAVSVILASFPARAPAHTVTYLLLQEISLQHGIKIGGFQVHSSGKRVVVVAGLDNLLKGAATQCIQVSATANAV